MSEQNSNNSLLEKKDMEKSDMEKKDIQKKEMPKGLKKMLKERYKREFVEVACPICNDRRIIIVPEESLPKCDRCKVDMVMKEILTEGKY